MCTFFFLSYHYLTLQVSSWQVLVLVSSVSLSLSDSTKPAPIRRQDALDTARTFHKKPSDPCAQKRTFGGEEEPPAPCAPFFYGGPRPQYGAPRPTYNTVQSVQVRTEYPTFLGIIFCLFSCPRPTTTSTRLTTSITRVHHVSTRSGSPSPRGRSLCTCPRTCRSTSSLSTCPHSHRA